MSTESTGAADPRDVLNYLLKHAALQLTTMTDSALEPFGIDSKDFGALRVLANQEPMSQLEVANSLGIDRTTMVALLDSLELKGVVTRRPHPTDRRRNVTELTESGRKIYAAATAAHAAAECQFLSPIGQGAAESLRATLRSLVTR